MSSDISTQHCMLSHIYLCLMPMLPLFSKSNVRKSIFLWFSLGIASIGGCWEIMLKLILQPKNQHFQRQNPKPAFNLHLQLCVSIFFCIPNQKRFSCYFVTIIELLKQLRELRRIRCVS